MAQEITVSGRIIAADTRQPLIGVNIVSGDNGTSSAEDGDFTIIITPGAVLRFTFIGYEAVELIPDRAFIEVEMQPAVLEGEAVYVSAIRAVEGVTPVAFSTLTSTEIQARYTVEDVPMVLAFEPGVHAYSESGNGTGYSYVSIRGFDQSRIAVMLDNVPLNDNESHQVYWVDHGDILSDADEVQIQRGIGNSLYGSSAFGGSINVTTGIRSDEPGISLSLGGGSYNTSKLSWKGSSGPMLDGKAFFTGRVSQIKSDGYRDNHSSIQQALSLAGEYTSGRLTNQFRALIGYENTDLAWWGVYSDYIDDRQARTGIDELYTDDFKQQIYSLNTNFRLRDDLVINNVAYLVKGSGYYEVFKYDRDYYSYNLDVNDQFADSVEQEMTTDLLRRKWIVNSYYGVIPTVTLSKPMYRLDIGAELRFYEGDHYGKVSDFSISELTNELGEGWYKYYQYLGKKTLATGFAHLMVNPIEPLRIIADLQYQFIDWSLDQKTIGHAPGHRLNADWDFLNPRLGLVYSFTDELSAFVNYGKAQKEPADNQIISADDVWSEPVMAAAEVIHDYELGVNYHSPKIRANLNYYLINYANEQLKNIDVEQEGEYEYYSAAGTIHQGLEYELIFQPTGNYEFGLNGSFSNHHFDNPDSDPLPGVPEVLLNLWGQFRLPMGLVVFTNLRYVGEQNMPAASELVSNEVLPAYLLVDCGITWSNKIWEASLKVNNLFDELYSTSGYDWDGWKYYWPGATRNGFLSVALRL